MTGFSRWGREPTSPARGWSQARGG